MAPPAKARPTVVGLPLSTLLSQALVAFTVELDKNELCCTADFPMAAEESKQLF